MCAFSLNLPPVYHSHSSHQLVNTSLDWLPLIGRRYPRSPRPRNEKGRFLGFRLSVRPSVQNTAVLRPTKSNTTDKSWKPGDADGILLLVIEQNCFYCPSPVDQSQWTADLGGYTLTNVIPVVLANMWIPDVHVVHSLLSSTFWTQVLKKLILANSCLLISAFATADWPSVA